MRKSHFFDKKRDFFSNFSHKFLIFYIENAITQKLLNYLTNISRKFRSLAEKNLVGGDKFLMIFKIFQKIDDEKIAVYKFVYRKLFTKMTISQKLFIYF